MKAIEPILMSKSEAEECVREIRDMSSAIRTNLVRLYQGEGWRALGYESFSDCVIQEFDRSSAYMYRQLATGLAENRLPIGDIGFNRESHMRVLLAKLKDDDDIVRAWEMANTMEDVPTADTYDHAASYVLVSKQKDEYPRLVRRMTNGEVSVSVAYRIMEYLSSIGDIPDIVKDLFSCVSDFMLVPMLYRLYVEDSDTWREIFSTLHIPSALDEQIPLARASASNLQAYLNVASNEHVAASIEASRDYRMNIREATDKVIQEVRVVLDYDSDRHPGLASAMDEYDSVIGRAS